MQVAAVALLVGGAHRQRELLFLLLQRLLGRLQLGGLNVNLALQALDICLNRRDLFLGQVDLALQRSACRFHVARLLGQFRNLFLNRRLLVLQAGQLILQLVRILSRARKCNAGRQHGREQRDHEDTGDDTRDQPGGAFLHHNGIRSFVLADGSDVHKFADARHRTADAKQHACAQIYRQHQPL